MFARVINLIEEMGLLGKSFILVGSAAMYGHHGASFRLRRDCADMDLDYVDLKEELPKYLKVLEKRFVQIGFVVSMEQKAEKKNQDCSYRSRK